MKNHIRYVYWVCDWSPEELLSAGLAGAFGVWILLLVHAISLLPSETVVSLQTLLPLWVWGVLGVAICIYSHAAVFVGSGGMRILAACFRFFFWLFLVLLTLLNYTPTSQLVIFVVLALSSGFVVWKNIGQANARE